MPQTTTPVLPDALTPVLVELLAQFRADMAHKTLAYGTTAPCGLLLETAEEAHLPPWEVWQAWASRHTRAIKNLLAQDDFAPSPETCQHLRNRLQDLLGHVIVGAFLCQPPPKASHSPAPPAVEYL